MKYLILGVLASLSFSSVLIAQGKITFTERQLQSSNTNIAFVTTPSLIKEHSVDKNDYLKKSSIQKKTGWILLGGGAAMGLAGALIYNATKDDESTTSNSGVLLQVIGVASAIVSIPFFVRSAKNKKLAAEISLNQQRVKIPIQNNFSMRSQPAVSLSIKLR